MAVAQRLSQGVYRDPKTGKTFQSATGQIPVAKPVAKPVVPGAVNPNATGQVTTQAAQPVAATPAATAPVANAGKWIRTGAGQYKNTATGKTLAGQATDPNKNPKYNVAKPVAAAPAPAAVAPPPAADAVPVAPTTDPAAEAAEAAQRAAYEQQVSNILFPGDVSAERIDNDVNFQQNLQSGNAKADAYYASRGLTGSGGEISGRNDLMSKLRADTASRLGEKDEIRANRLNQIQQFQSGVNERGTQNGINNNLRWAEMMLNQDPSAQTWAATTGAGDLTTAAGKAKANYQASNYEKILAAGGGGGGGGQTMAPYMGPRPTTADMSNIDPSIIAGRGSSNSGLLNILSGGLTEWLASGSKTKGSNLKK